MASGTWWLPLLGITCQEDRKDFQQNEIVTCWLGRLPALQMPNKAKIKKWLLSKHPIQSTVRKAWCKDEGEKVAVKCFVEARKDQPLSDPGPSGAMGVQPWSSTSDGGLPPARRLVSRSPRAYFLHSLGEVSQNSMTWFLARVVVKLLNWADFSAELECIHLSQRGSKQRQGRARKEGAPSSSHSVNGTPIFSLSSSQRTGGTQLGCPPFKSRYLTLVLYCGSVSSLPGVAWTPILPILAEAF